MEKKQIEAWKAEHGAIFMLQVENKELYLRAPKMVDYKRAFAKLTEGEIAFAEELLNILFIGGDEIVKTDDAYFLPIKDQLVKLADYEDPIIEKGRPNSTIIVGDVSCKVRVITREDLRIAEAKNPNNKPFVTQEKLFEMIEVEADEAFNDKNKAEIRMPLYKAIEQLQKQKVGFLKKL